MPDNTTDGQEADAYSSSRFSMKLNGQPIACGNGLDSKGSIQVNLLKHWGQTKYTHVWGKNGVAIRNAQNLIQNSQNLDQVAEAAMYLHIVETFRQKDIYESRNKAGGSLCPDKCKCKECGHDYFLNLVRETREGLEALAPKGKIAPKGKREGTITSLHPGEHKKSKGFGFICSNDKVLHLLA